MSPRLAKTKARGYGAEHKRLRKRWQLEVDASLVACARCGRWIAPGSGISDMWTVAVPSTPARSTEGATAPPSSTASSASAPAVSSGLTSATGSSTEATERHADGDRGAHHVPKRSDAGDSHAVAISLSVTRRHGKADYPRACSRCGAERTQVALPSLRGRLLRQPTRPALRAARSG